VARTNRHVTRRRSLKSKTLADHLCSLVFIELAGCGSAAVAAGSNSAIERAPRCTRAHCCCDPEESAWPGSSRERLRAFCIVPLEYEAREALGLLGVAERTPGERALGRSRAAVRRHEAVTADGA
jgi:hypothetical protein